MVEGGQWSSCLFIIHLALSSLFEEKSLRVNWQAIKTGRIKKEAPYLTHTGTTCVYLCTRVATFVAASAL